MAENYGEIRDVLEQSNPEGMEQVRAYVNKAKKSIELEKKELDETIELLQYIIANQRNYQQIKERLQKDFDVELPDKFDPVYFGMGLVVLQVMQAEGSKFAKGGIADLAQDLQSKGRNGDTILAHISPEEARILKALGGSGSINPETGLPEFFKFLKKAFQAIGDVIGDVVKGVGNVVEDIVESPVGRILATAALTAVGAPYLAAYGIGASGTAAIVSGGLTAATGGDLGDIAKSALLAYAGSELVQGIKGADVLDVGSPEWSTAYPSGEVPLGTLGAPAELVAPLLSAAQTINYDPSMPLTAPAATDFYGPIAPPSLAGAELPTGIEQLTAAETPLFESAVEPSVEDLLGSSDVNWDNYGDLSSLETPLASEVQQVEPSLEDEGFGPPIKPDIDVPTTAPPTGFEALESPTAAESLDWMDKISPSQAAAAQGVAPGTLPGTTFLDKAAYAIGAAGEKLADKLTTPAGLASAAYGIASLADLSKSGSGGGGGGGGGWSGVMPRYTLERSVIPSAFERKPYERTEIINPDGTKTYTPTPVMGRAFFTAPKYVPRATATTTGTTSESTMPNTQPQDEPSVVPAAQGGIMALNKGRYLRGRTDGMADKIPSNIDGVQPAALSHGEFVIPADVVSHLGNGNSEAGADVLYKMMDRVRKARTGNPKQGKQINPDKFVPGGIVALNAGGVTQSGTGVTGPVATSNSSQLSTWAAPTVTETLGKAEALATEEVKPYMGQLTATASPVQTKAFDVASKLFDPQKQLTYVDPNDPAKKSMPVLNTYMNPYLEGVQKPMMAALERDADIRQQAIQSQFARAGAFGGSRELLARMENERALAEQKERVLGKTQADAFTAGADLYGRERDRELRALDSMLRAGGTERDIESEAVKALRGEYEFQRTEPMRLLKDYIDMLKGMPIKTETSSAQLSDLQKLGLTLTEASKLFDLLGGGK